MALSETLIPEFDHEMANTRRTLERVPEGKFGWKPHEKSMTMGKLGNHIAEMPGWVPMILDGDSFDVAPPGGSAHQSQEKTSRKEILELFDKNVSTARSAILAASDQQLGKSWSLLQGGKPIFTLPRIGVLRSLIMNHTIHHRAQLGVYLRLNNVPVPAIYGPSADEGNT